MAPQTAQVPTLDDLLSRSAATPAFAADVRAYATKSPATRVTANSGAPPVKVLRAISQLLETRPNLAIESVEVHGESGCSDFRGSMKVRVAGAEHRFRFVWDCKWKATQLGWQDMFGDPDQMKAAREYGYQCFEVFEPA